MNAARPSLTSLAQAHGTDKAGEHSYTDFYEELFEGRRDEALTLLEIGVGGYHDPKLGGESLRTWSDYFPKARIIGIDLFDKSPHADDRITILQGSQTDRAFLRAVAANGPFDIVIDDGSHVPAHVIASFEALFPHLSDGGWYVVEDVQTSYWPSYGGALRRRSRRTSMGWLKDRVDGLNFAEFQLPAYRPTDLDLMIEEIRFRHNLAAIRKGDNSEPSNAIQPHPSGYRAWAREHVRTRAKASARRLTRQLARVGSRGS